MEAAQLVRPDPCPDGYGVILVDVPWKYRDKASAGKRGAEHKYECISVDEAKEMNVRGVAATDCALFMWVTAPFLADGFELMSHWGFKYKTVAFVWVKHTKHGKLHFGMGNYTRSNAEYVLLGVRGKPRRVDASVRQIVTSKKGRHSEKPTEVNKRIELLMGPDVNRLELFARRPRDGWDCVGNQLNEMDVFDFLSNGKNPL